jgi:hypothetical protein
MESEAPGPPPSGAEQPAAPAQPAPSNDPVRLEERATGFSAFAPPDFILDYDAERGVYEIRSDQRGLAIEYTRAQGTEPPVDVARLLVKQRGFEVVSEQADPERASVLSKRPDGRRWTVIVRRDGPETLSATGFGRSVEGAQADPSGDERVLEWIASSAAGGKAVVLPETKVEDTVKPIELEDFTTQDGMVRGKVPKEPGWAVGGSGGSLEAYNPQRGELYLGIPAYVCLPGTSAAMIAQMYPTSLPIAPLLPPDGAVLQVWPQLRRTFDPTTQFDELQIESAYPQNMGPPFNAALFGIRFQRNRIPWRGTILAATASIPADERWLFYFSELAVPDSDDSSVSQALLEAWKAFDPSRAMGQRSSAATQASAAVTTTIQSVNTLRQQTFERTAAAWGNQFRS